MHKILLILIFVGHLLASKGQYSPLWVQSVGGTTEEKLYGVSPYIMTDIVGAGRYHDKKSRKVYPYLTRFSPGGTLLWDKHYETETLTFLKTTAVEPDGNIYAAGRTKDNPFEPYTDFFVMKVNGKGELLWKKQIKGGGYGQVNSMVFNAETNKIIVGGFQDVNFYNEHHGVIMQLDTAGNKEWEYNYSGSYGEEIQKIILTRDGGIAFVGFERINNSGNRMMLAGKINASGEEEWVRGYELGSMAIANSIVELRTGGFAVCGLIRESQEPVHDIVIMKITKNGTKVWERVVREKYDEEGVDLIQTKKDNLMMLAYSKSRMHGKSDIWLLEYDIQGNRLWDNVLTSRTVDFGHQLFENKYGSLVVAGSTFSHARRNWDAVLLYYEETKAPVVKIKNPPHQKEVVDNKDFVFRAQLSSKDSVNVVQVMHGNRQLDDDYKVFYKSTEKSVYKANIKAKTKLEKGPNYFWVKAINKYGEITSKVYTVIYAPKGKVRELKDYKQGRRR